MSVAGGSAWRQSGRQTAFRAGGSVLCTDISGFIGGKVLEVRAVEGIAGVDPARGEPGFEPVRPLL